MKARTIALILVTLAASFIIGFPHAPRPVHADPPYSGITRSAIWFPFVSSVSGFDTVMAVSGSSSGLEAWETPEFRLYFFDLNGVCTPGDVIHDQNGPNAHWISGLYSIKPNFVGSVLVLTNLPQVKAGGCITDTATGTYTDIPAVVDYGITAVNTAGQIVRAGGTAPPPGWQNLAPNQTSIDPALHHTTLFFPMLCNTPGYDTGFSITNSFYDPNVTSGRTATLYLYDTGGVIKRKVVVDMDSTSSTPGVYPGYAALFSHVAKDNLYGDNRVESCDEFNGGFSSEPLGYMLAIVNIPYARGWAFINYILGGAECNDGYPAMVDNNIWGVDSSYRPQRLIAPTTARTSIVVPYVVGMESYQTGIFLANTSNPYYSAAPQLFFYNLNGEMVKHWTVPGWPPFGHTMRILVSNNSFSVIVDNTGVGGDSLPLGFIGWLLITVDVPNVYGVETVSDTGPNSLGAANCIIDNDIIGANASTGAIQRQNPLPADSGDTWEIPLAAENPDIDTFAITINTCNTADMQANHVDFTYEGYADNPAQTHYGPHTEEIANTATLAPSRMWQIGGVYPDFPAGPFSITTSTPNAYGSFVENFFSDITFVADQPVKPTTIPLGGDANVVAGSGGDIYVPTKYGGTLRIESSAGQVELYYKGQKIHDAANPLEWDIPAEDSTANPTIPDAHGWYRVKLVNAGQANVSNTFTQTAQASTRPWDFYYWPMKGDYVREPINGGDGQANSVKAAGDDIQDVAPPGAVNPGDNIIRCGKDGILQSDAALHDELVNMYPLFSIAGQHNDPDGPLVRFDAHFNLVSPNTARETAADQGKGAVDDWEGYCDGASLASMWLNEPVPAQGANVTRDDLKGFWALLGTSAQVTDDLAGGGNITYFGCRDANGDHYVPTAGADNSDGWADDLQNALEKGLRVKVGGKYLPLWASLGSANGKPKDKWNHVLWKYESTWVEVVGGPQHLYEITMTIYANGDHFPTNPPNDRTITYKYRVQYILGSVNLTPGAQGMVQGQDFISVSKNGNYQQYAPYQMVRVTNVVWQTPVPQVTEARVRQIDTANPGENP